MPDERVDLAQRQGRRGPAVEVAPEEAVGGHAELERGVGGLFGDGGTVLPGEGEDAEDATDAGGAVVTVDVVADGGDGGAGPLGGGEQGEGTETPRNWGQTPGGPSPDRGRPTVDAGVVFADTRRCSPVGRLLRGQPRRPPP